MPTFPIITPELVHRIERHIAHGKINRVRDVMESGGAAVEHFGSAIAIKTRWGAPVNYVFGFAREDLALLPRILAFYAQDNIKPNFGLSSRGFCREVCQALSAEGFSAESGTQAMLYALPTIEAPSAPPEVTVAKVSDETIDTFLQLAAEGLQWSPEWRSDVMEGTRRQWKRGDFLAYLARFRNEPAGVGVLSIHDGIGGLGMGTTLPAFRQRGCHTALLHARLAAARDAGCELTIGGATFGSGSFRNQQRVGLRLAYLESTWRRA